MLEPLTGVGAAEGMSTANGAIAAIGSTKIDFSVQYSEIRWL